MESTPTRTTPDQPAAAPDQLAGDRKRAYGAMAAAVWRAEPTVRAWVGVLRRDAVAQYGTAPDQLIRDATYAQALHVQAALSELIASINHAGQMSPAPRPRLDLDTDQEA